jgi:ubiquinone/menaquinone biosynthesis C-methylase UbiE
MRPFSYYWIIQKQLSTGDKILDVGCGDGKVEAEIESPERFRITGIDLYKPYIATAKKLGLFEKLIIGDIRKVGFKKKQFDVVLSSQVVEHLEKKEALKLIKTMEKVASKKVVIATTNGFFPYDPLWGHDANKLNIHKSGWSKAEFESLGYKVYGQGTGFIYKPGGLAHRYKSFQSLFFSLSLILSPLNYFFPPMSVYLIAVKDFSKK